MGFSDIVMDLLQQISSSLILITYNMLLAICKKT